MEKQIESLDLDANLGSVTLSNGQTLEIPKLSMLKIIKIVKFLGIDGSKLYSECREILMDESMDDLERFAVVLETLDEKQLVRIFSIMLDLPDEAVLKLDPNEMLEILVVLSDKLDLKKTYSLIRSLMKKMFNKEMPETMGEWFDQVKANRVQRVQALQEMRERAAAAQTDGKVS